MRAARHVSERHCRGRADRGLDRRRPPRRRRPRPLRRRPRRPPSPPPSRRRAGPAPAEAAPARSRAGRRRRPRPRQRARPRLWRVPARLLSHRLCDRDPPGRGEGRRQGDDAARRALCPWLRRRARRQEGHRMVPARRRARRPRGDVRARACSTSPDAPAPSTASRPPSCSPPPPSSGTFPPPTTSACSISRASCSRRISRARPNCSAAPRRPGIRKRNTRSPRSTRKAAA